MLEINIIRKSYINKPALSDVKLSFPRGEIVGLSEGVIRFRHNGGAYGMKKLMQRLSPPGMNVKAEKAITVICLILSALWGTLYFLTNYIMERDVLFTVRGGKLVPKQGAVISEFAMTVDPGMIFGFYVTMLIIAGFTLFRLAYFYQGSKSIYLMRRLPQKGETAKRVLALPALWIAGTALIMLLFTGLMAAVYLLATPKGCLPAQPFKDVWEVFACWKSIL